MNPTLLHYSDTKTKNVPTLLFIHGYGMDETIWEQVSNLLKAKFRIVCIRLPLLEAYTEKTGRNIAAQIAALLRQLSITHCSIWGHSLGGYIALEFMSLYREMVAHFGLIHSTYKTDTADRLNVRKKIIEHLTKYGKHSFLLQSIPGCYGDAYKKKNYHHIIQQIEHANNTSTANLIAYQEYMINRKDYTSLMQEKCIKKTILLGEEDTLIQKNSLDYQTWEKANHLNVVSLRAVAHMSMLENPTLLAKSIHTSLS